MQAKANFRLQIQAFSAHVSNRSFLAGIDLATLNKEIITILNETH